jgi:hypothetical protein
MLGLAENDDDIGVAMFGSLGGVTLGIWFAHRAVVKERLRYERGVEAKLDRLLQVADEPLKRRRQRHVAGSRRRRREGQPPSQV